MHEFLDKSKFVETPDGSYSYIKKRAVRENEELFAFVNLMHFSIFS